MDTTRITPTAPAHQPAPSAPSRWFMGGRADIRLSSDQTGGWLCVHDHRLPAGAATPLHVQPDDDESFVVLDGEVLFHIDGTSVSAGVDDALHVPRGVPHAFLVTSPGGARLLIIGSPAGHERFFLAAGDVPDGPGLPPAPAGLPDMARMAAAAAAAGFELLGPPPFAAPGA